MSELHETHVCRDCGAEITLPFGVNGRYGCVECGMTFARLDDLAEHDHATHGEAVRYVVEGQP